MDKSEGAYNLIAVTFESDDAAYPALAALDELAGRHQLELEEAVVVERDRDGTIVEKKRIGASHVPGVAGGGLVGLVIGIIGGPPGMLIGGASGVLLGSLFELYEAEESGSVLAGATRSVTPGHALLVAEVTERTPEIVDAAMKRLGGTVRRRPVADVESEVVAAAEARREAARDAYPQ
jgi:uncharacterized membrane protein